MAAVSRHSPPYTRRIDAETTHYTVVSTARLGDHPWMAVRIRWSVRTFTEHLFIGGRRTRRIQNKDDEEEVTCAAVEGPAVLRSEEAFRFFLHKRMLRRRLLPRLARHIGAGGDKSRWNEVVTAGLVERIVADATLADRSGRQRYLVDASVHVDVTSVYNEAEALLLSCEGAAVAPSLALDGDAAAQCPICMEELADDGRATGLPGCSHAFHRSCILKWFHRAPTCPYCRRDMMQHLDHRAREVWVLGQMWGRGADLLDALVEPMFRGQGGAGM